MKSLFTALHLATGAGPALTLLLALVILLFHIWASRRSPRYWNLGGIVPLAWFLCLGILLFNGRLALPGELGHLLFPTLVLLLLWLEGHLAAKKRELARMKATDL